MNRMYMRCRTLSSLMLLLLGRGRLKPPGES